MQRPTERFTLDLSLDSRTTLAAFFQASIAAQLPVALWRRPGCSQPEAIADLSGAAQPAHIDLAAGEPAFVLSPFSNAQASLPLRIRADLRLTAFGLHTSRELWNGQRQRYEHFFTAYHAALAAGQRSGQSWYTYPPGSAPRGSTCDAYCRLVDSAIDFIVASGIKKVVVSRSAAVPLPVDFDPVVMFQALSQRYPAAFVSLVAMPGVGTWIGASPELLLSADRHALHTMALAGTQARSDDRPLHAVRWNPKELEEQALVSDYVRDFFSRASVGVVHETGPRTVAAGNVLHLQTDFRVELPSAELPALAHRVLHELHPTSAVCGMPKDKALAFILQHEGYDRSFYSGYLGPVHVDDQSHLYVNLRCMQLGSDTAHLYVGGGVTADSDPEAEWRETELKAGTLLAVFREGAIAPTSTQPTPDLFPA